MSEIEPVAGDGVAVPPPAFDLERHEAGLLSIIDRMGLPAEGILVPVGQRIRLFKGVEDTLALLPEENRNRSAYLSKFLAAVASGLFDAALNYLWDETVNELRRRVANYDLEYFFDVAVGSQPEKRKRLTDADDLRKIDDQDLIQATQKMGLISEVGFKQLDLVRYMRNHASAAHPNQVELRAIQVLEYLETCIVEVITLPETTTVAEIKRLLTNVKTEAIDSQDATKIASFFQQLDENQAVNLGKGLFGIYSSTSSEAQARTNVRQLFPSLWPYLPEDARYQFGIRYGRFVANGDQGPADLARELLDEVEAQRYLPTQTRIVELDVALDDLYSTHHGYDNFHTEPLPARTLRKLVGPTPHVPVENRTKYVHTVVDCYLGNPWGVSTAASGVYTELVEAFTPDEALIALLSFTTPVIESELQMPKPAARWRTLLKLLRPRVVGEHAKALIDALDAYTGPMDKAALEISVKKALRRFRSV